MNRRLFLAALPGAAAWPKQWDQTEFPDWSRSFVDRILTDSPWARPLSLPFVYKAPRVGGSGVKTEIYLTVRLSSALPIRQALALEDGKREPKPEPASTIVEIFGLPATMFSERTAELEEELQRTAMLSTSKRSVRAKTVEVPQHGTHIAATIEFPRWESLDPSEGDLQFGAVAGPMKFAQKFRLKDLVYRGKVEY